MSEDEGELENPVTLTAGERLRAAREAANMSIEDVATSTRIPTRHLSSLETGDFSKLPAPTYSVGFARSYAAAVGLDRNDIGEQMRAEIGGTRIAAHQAEQFEPLDPARTMPKWLILAVIVGIIAVALLATWLNNRSMNAPDNVTAADADPAAPPAAPAATPVAAQPVTITATSEAWVSIKDGATLLKEGVMKAGERFEVPPTASAPVLTTAKAEGLTINVGSATAPSIGPAATRIKNVSLLPADLMRGPNQAVAPVARPAAAPVVSRPAPTPVAARPKPAALPATKPAPATNSAEPAPPPQ